MPLPLAVWKTGSAALSIRVLVLAPYICHEPTTFVQESVKKISPINAADVAPSVVVAPLLWMMTLMWLAEPVSYPVAEWVDWETNYFSTVLTREHRVELRNTIGASHCRAAQEVIAVLADSVCCKRFNWQLFPRDCADNIRDQISTRISGTGWQVVVSMTPMSRINWTPLWEFSERQQYQARCTNAWPFWIEAWMG